VRNFSPTPNPQAWGPSLVSCLWQLIQYIRSCLPYLEAFSICSLRTCHGMVTRDPPNIGFHFITMTISGEEYKLCSSLCSFFQSLITFCLLGPNILFSTLFKNTFYLCSSLSVTMSFTPIQATSKIIVVYIWIFKCLEGREEDKRFWTEW